MFTTASIFCKRVKKKMLLFFGFIVHAVLLFSVVDIHYQGLYSSPVERRGCRNVSALSNRVVLMFDYYLSAETFFSHTGFNHTIDSIMDTSPWGISYVSPPNDTKAKFQSLTTGTEYDGASIWSALNLPPRYKDSLLKDLNVVYFGSRQWMFNSNKNWTQKSLNNESFYSVKKSKEKSLFLLDLHTYENIGHLIRQINTVMEAFEDNSTTFIFTSLSVDNKSKFETPFLIFGSGIETGGKPRIGKWRKDKKVRLNQTDISVIIAILLGIPIPAHSVGILKHEILTMDEKRKMEAVFCNQKQLGRLLEAESKDIKEGLFKFIPLRPNWDIKDLKKKQKSYFLQRNYTSSLKLSKEILNRYFHSLKYYRNYFGWMLRTVIISLYVSWSFLLLCSILNEVTKLEKTDKDVVLNNAMSLSSVWSKMTLDRTFCNRKYTLLGIIWDISALIKALIVSTFVYLQNWPLHFLIYFFALDIAWWKICRILTVFFVVFKEWAEYFRIGNHIIATIIATSFIFFNYRVIYVLIMSCITISYIYESALKTRCYILTLWISSSITISLILFNSSLFWNVPKLSVSLWMLFVGVFLYFKKPEFKSSIWTFAMIFSLAVVYVSPVMENKYNELTGLKISWILAFLCHLFPIFASDKGINRILQVSFSLACPFLMMTFDQEGLGLLAYSILLTCMYIFELSNAGLTMDDAAEIGTSTLVQPKDVKLGFLLMFYSRIAFYFSGFSEIGGLTSLKSLKSFSMTKIDIWSFMMNVYKISITCLILLAVAICICKKVGGNIGHSLKYFLFLNTLIGFYCFLELDSYNDSGETLLMHIAPNLLSMIMIVCYPVAYVLITASLSVKNLKESIVTKTKRITKFDLK